MRADTSFRERENSQQSLVLSSDTSLSMIVFALHSVKTEHSIRIRDLLSEAKTDKKLASGALVLAFMLGSLLKTRLIFRAVMSIPMSVMSLTVTLYLGTEKK